MAHLRYFHDIISTFIVSFETYFTGCDIFGSIFFPQATRECSRGNLKSGNSYIII